MFHHVSFSSSSTPPQGSIPYRRDPAWPPEEEFRRRPGHETNEPNSPYPSLRRVRTEKYGPPLWGTFHHRDLGERTGFREIHHIHQKLFGEPLGFRKWKLLQGGSEAVCVYKWLGLYSLGFFVFGFFFFFALDYYYYAAQISVFLLLRFSLHACMFL